MPLFGDVMEKQFIQSKHNPLILHVKKLFRSRSYRESCGEFAADGAKLLCEAISWCPGLTTVIATADCLPTNLPEQIRLVEVPEALMCDISLMQAPQGVVFVGRIPAQTPGTLKRGSLILDGIQDPGNLGTILRTADALNVPVLLTQGCADIYNPKVIRATMGAVFRAAPGVLDRAEVILACREQGIALTVTALTEQARDIRSVQLSDHAVVIGSEGQGVSQEFRNAASCEVIIPMNPHCESLNAATAAAIVCWRIFEQLS